MFFVKNNLPFFIFYHFAQDFSLSIQNLLLTAKLVDVLIEKVQVNNDVRIKCFYYVLWYDHFSFYLNLFFF